MSISVGCDPAVVCYSRDDVRYNRVTASGIFAYIREFCEQDVNVEWLACDFRHNMLEYFVRENVSENDSVARVDWATARRNCSNSFGVIKELLLGLEFDVVNTDEQNDERWNVPYVTYCLLFE